MRSAFRALVVFALVVFGGFHFYLSMRGFPALLSGGPGSIHALAAYVGLLSFILASLVFRNMRPTCLTTASWRSFLCLRGTTWASIHEDVIHLLKPHASAPNHIHDAFGGDCLIFTIKAPTSGLFRRPVPTPYDSTFERKPCPVFLSLNVVARSSCLIWPRSAMARSCSPASGTPPSREHKLASQQ